MTISERNTPGNNHLYSDSEIAHAGETARMLTGDWVSANMPGIADEHRQRIIDFVEHAARAAVEHKEDLFHNPEVLAAIANHAAPHLAEERRELDLRSKVDSLTGLANAEQLNKALEGTKDDPDTVVLFIDANNFGKINKKISDRAGDEAIKTIAGHLSKVAERVMGTDTRVFRKGGDEFVILAPKDKADFLRSEIVSTFGTSGSEETLPEYATSLGRFNINRASPIGFAQDGDGEEIKPRFGVGPVGYINYRGVFVSLSVGIGPDKDLADKGAQLFKKSVKRKIRNKVLASKVLKNDYIGVQ